MIGVWLPASYELVSWVFLHWDERRDISTTDGAGLLGFDKLLATVLTHTEMTAWHDKGVLRIWQADKALSIWIVIIDCLLAFLSSVIFSHSIDRLELEWQSIDLKQIITGKKKELMRIGYEIKMWTYKSDLLDNMNAIDVLITIFSEGAVGHHSILGPVVLIVDRNDHWIVIFDWLGQLECHKIIYIELDLARLNLLVTARFNAKVLDVILTIGRVEHLWSIVWIFLLSDTHVDSNVSITKRIILEGHVKLRIFG